MRLGTGQAAGSSSLGSETRKKPKNMKCRSQCDDSKQKTELRASNEETKGQEKRTELAGGMIDW